MTLLFALSSVFWVVMWFLQFRVTKRAQGNCDRALALVEGWKRIALDKWASAPPADDDYPVSDDEVEAK